MAWCLPRDKAEAFKQALITGKINPQNLIEMTTQERREFLAQIVGARDAAHVNALYESKLLNKNYIQGVISWAKRTMAEYPGTQKDLLKTIERLEAKLEKKEITPDEAMQKVGDLVNQRLGLQLGDEQFERLVDLASTVTQAQLQMEQSPRRKLDLNATPEEKAPTEEEIAYGLAYINLLKYKKELKQAVEKGTLKEWVAPENLLWNLADVSGVAKTLKASCDLSYTLRQGFKVYAANPKIWLQNTIKEFQDVINTFGADNVLDYVMAEIVSDPNFENMKKDKLAVINVIEEEIPMAEFVEKIPVLGKAIHVSDVAFSAFALRSRAQLYNYYTEILKKADEARGEAGRETTGRGLGRFVNSLTGRGEFIGKGGKILKVSNEVLDIANKLFFAPRYVMSNLDFLTAFAFTDIDPVLKKEAAKALLRGVGTMAMALAPIYFLYPEQVELDPRSADFGTIKSGNTRFDITGGLKGYFTLAARLLTLSTKSSTTKVVRKLNSGEYGATTAWDVILNFAEGKAAPAAGILIDIMQGEGFAGEKIDLQYIAEQALLPIIVQEAKEAYKTPDSANLIVTLIAEALGIGTTTYMAEVGWDKSTAKWVQEAKQRWGEEEFKRRVDLSNKMLNDAINASIKSKISAGKPAEMTAKEIEQIKNRIKKQMFGK